MVSWIALLKRVSFSVQVLLFLLLTVGSGVVLFSLVGSQPLVHDEAVYLTESRSWFEGTPASEFKIYRPIGMPLLGWIALHVSDEEENIRYVGVLFGVVTIIFLFFLFRSVFDVWVAMLVSLVVLTSNIFLRSTPEFLNDIPSSGLIFGALWLIWMCYYTAGRSVSVYVLPILLALSFYLRYGIVLAFAVIAGATAIFLSMRFLSKKERSFKGVFISAGLFIIFLLPHFYQSMHSHNGLFGILLRGGQAAGRDYLGQGLVEYMHLLPQEMGGWVFGIFAIVGIVATFWTIFISKLDTEKLLGIAWLGTIGLLHFVLTGLLIHAEARYVFLSMTLLAGVGVAGIYSLIKYVLPKATILFVLLLTFVCFSFGVMNYKNVQYFFDMREQKVSRNMYVLASEAVIKDNPSNPECAVWSDSFRPEISWYSKCYTLPIKDPVLFDRDFLIHSRRDHYSIVFTKIDSIQIDQFRADEFGVHLEEIFRKKVSASLGDVIVYRMSKARPFKDAQAETSSEESISPSFSTSDLLKQ